VLVVGSFTDVTVDELVELTTDEGSVVCPAVPQATRERPNATVTITIIVGC
jgi:hypothetical protein